MSLFFAVGSPSHVLSAQDLKQGLFRALDALGPRRKVIAVPPDITRHHSRAGELTRFAFEYYGGSLSHILPAVGTHKPMTDREIGIMYGDLPRDRFAVHDFRNDLVSLGEVP